MHMVLCRIHTHSTVAVAVACGLHVRSLVRAQEVNYDLFRIMVLLNVICQGVIIYQHHMEDVQTEL